MDGYQWWNAIFDNIAIPILAAFGGIIVYLIKSFADRITKSIVAKNEAASMEKVFETKSYIIKEIDGIVAAAVASNMQIAEDMKKAGQKLTEEQIEQLQNSAKELVLNSLPASLTEESGSMIQIVGGQDKLYSLINALMEKYVYEYKLKRMSGESADQIAEQTTTAMDNKNKKTFSITPSNLYKRKQ